MKADDKMNDRKKDLSENAETDEVAILFDMDGTLIDSEHLHVQSWKEILQQYHLFFEDAWFHQWIGVSDINMCKQIEASYQLPVSWDVLLQNKRNLFRKKAEQELQTIAGVKPGLQQLQHLPMAVVTMSNAYDAAMSLRVTGIEKFFKGLVSADDVEQHKPHPEPYLQASALLKTNAARCIAVEDSISGVASAKAAGCFTIGVANSVDAGRLNEADLVLKNSGEAMRYLIRHLVLYA